MYRGYNLEISMEELNELTGNEMENFSQKQQSIRQNIKSTQDDISFENVIGDVNIIGSDDSIDTSELVNQWFPKIEADIFISHSHKDEELAIKLAAWLEEEFGLKSFIDSTVWGYADDLLKELDDEYCYEEELHSYDYTKRNYTTSHIHLMLASALSSMIDKTECLIFINTPNSVSFDDATGSKTESAWINYELFISKYIQKEYPRIEKDLEMFNERDSELPSFIYDAEVNHLETINVETLGSWMSSIKENIMYKNFVSKRNNLTALDYLYFENTDLERLNEMLN